MRGWAGRNCSRRWARVAVPRSAGQAGRAGGAHRRARRRVQLPAGGAGWSRRRARGLDKPAALRRRVIQALESRHQPLRQPKRSPAATRPRFRTSGRRRPGGVFQQEGIGAKKNAQIIRAARGRGGRAGRTCGRAGACSCPRAGRAGRAGGRAVLTNRRR